MKAHHYITLPEVVPSLDSCGYRLSHHSAQAEFCGHGATATDHMVTTMHPIVHHPVVTKLSVLFENADFSDQLASTLSSFGPHDDVSLRIDAVVCASNSLEPKKNVNSLPLVCNDSQTH